MERKGDAKVLRERVSEKTLNIRRGEDDKRVFRIEEDFVVKEEMVVVVVVVVHIQL